MPRTRVKTVTAGGGGKAYRRVNGTTTTDTTQSPYSKQVDRCVDEVGSTTDHNLLIEHTTRNLRPMNGEDGDPNGLFYRFYRDFYPLGGDAVGHAPLPGRPSASADATTLLARTNPGRAEVSIPVFVGELKDLPHMVKSAGEYIMKRRKYWFRSTAGQYLSYQFGWKPLMSDLRKMLDFESMVTDRAKEIERLYSNKGLKRRMRLGNWGAVAESNPTIASSLGTTVATRRSIFTQSQRWGTVRWLPTDRPMSILDDRPDYRALARKAVFGLSLQAEDVWNLLPWTWLVDWFTNAGDYLVAHGNRVPAVPGPVNIMTKTQSSHVWTRTNSNWVDWKYSTADYVTLERYVGGGSLQSTLEFLSPRQMSILGALSVTRAKGSARYSS